MAVIDHFRGAHVGEKDGFVFFEQGDVPRHLDFSAGEFFKMFDDVGQETFRVNLGDVHLQQIIFPVTQPLADSMINCGNFLVTEAGQNNSVGGHVKNGPELGFRIHKRTFRQLAPGDVADGVNNRLEIAVADAGGIGRHMVAPFVEPKLRFFSLPGFFSFYRRAVGNRSSFAVDDFTAEFSDELIR